jgi:hypothetical protein
MPIIRICLVLLLAVALTASAQDGPTPAALAAARAYGVPPPPPGGTITGPLEVGVPGVLAYVDTALMRVTMIFTGSHSVLLSDVSSDWATVTPRFAFNPFGYYLVNGSQLSAPVYQPPAGLDERWPMVVPLYQIVSQVAQQLSAAEQASYAAELDSVLSQIISGGNEARGQITGGGFAECIDHYVDGVYQGCW